MPLNLIRNRFQSLNRFCLLLIFLVAMSPIAISQETAPTPPKQGDKIDETIDIDTNLVTLTLTVTDRWGRFIAGLEKEAFEIFDEKKQQNITFFSDSDAPASIGILFDISGSMNGEKITQARNALSRFMNISHPRDEYFLIAFNKRAQLLMDRTRDSEAVLNRLTLVEPKHNTALYDACYLGVERVTRGTHQKKALLIISDGQDNASRYNFKEVRRLMKESDVTIYTVGILSGRDTGSTLGVQGQAFLDELARVTGGQSFYPRSEVEMDEIFERIALELRHQYSIGYTPKGFEQNGEWRKVKVKVKKFEGLGRLTVRYRRGYYATPRSN